MSCAGCPELLVPPGPAATPNTMTLLLPLEAEPLRVATASLAGGRMKPSPAGAWGSMRCVLQNFASAEPTIPIAVHCPPACATDVHTGSICMHALSTHA